MILNIGENNFAKMSVKCKNDIDDTNQGHPYNVKDWKRYTDERMDWCRWQYTKPRLTHDSFVYIIDSNNDTDNRDGDRDDNQMIQTDMISVDISIGEISSNICMFYRASCYPDVFVNDILFWSMLTWKKKVFFPSF